MTHVVMLSGTSVVYVSSRFLKYFSILISYDKTNLLLIIWCLNMVNKLSDDQSCKLIAKGDWNFEVTSLKKQINIVNFLVIKLCTPR